MCPMLDYTLTAEELAQLRAEHRRTRDQREADRIKAVVSLASGWTAEQVAAVLLIDPNTARNYFRRTRTPVSHGQGSRRLGRRAV